MFRESWNFHNDIAIPLESDACQYYGDTGRPLTKIYDADAIESGNFVEVMLILLREATHMINDNTAIDEFVRSCSPYLGMRGSEIPKETAQELYDKFKAIFEG